MRATPGKVSVHPTRTKTVALRVDPKVWHAVKSFAKTEHVTIEDLAEAALLSFLKEHNTHGT